MPEPSQTHSAYAPRDYLASMSEMARNFITYGYPDLDKWEERLPQVGRLKDGEHVSFVLGEIQQECIRAKQAGKTIRSVMNNYPPHKIAQLIKDHTIATNREGGLGRMELLKSTQLPVTPMGMPQAKRSFWTRIAHPFRKEE